MLIAVTKIRPAGSCVRHQRTTGFFKRFTFSEREDCEDRAEYLAEAVKIWQLHKEGNNTKVTCQEVQLKFFRPRRHGNQEEGSISRLESSVESREYISHSASLHSTSVTGGGCPCDPFLVPKLYVDPVLFDNSCFDFFTAFCLCKSILLREWTGDGSWLLNFSPRVPSHGNRIFPAVFRLTLLRVCWSSSCPRVHSSRCFTFFSMRLIFLVILTLVHGTCRSTLSPTS